MDVKKYIRNNIDLRKDELSRWALLRPSSLAKDEFRMGCAEVELIESYCVVLHCICEAIQKDHISCVPTKNQKITYSNEFNFMVLKAYSLAIPFLYIARHLTELSIKYYLDDQGDTVLVGHKISKLWPKWKKYAPHLSLYDSLIKSISILDDDELHFRYIKDINGNEYTNKPTFIDYEKVYRDTEQLSL